MYYATMILRFRTDTHDLFAKLVDGAVPPLITALAHDKSVDVSVNKKGNKVFKATENHKIKINEGELMFYKGYYAVLETVKS